MYSLDVRRGIVGKKSCFVGLYLVFSWRELVINWHSLFLVPYLVHSFFSNWHFHWNCHLVAWQGVLEAVRISLAGYPTRRTYAEFVDRFAVLVPELMIGRYLSCPNEISRTQMKIYGSYCFFAAWNTMQWLDLVDM